MIALPLNDHECLNAATQTIVDMVERRDETLVEIAKRHADTASLAAWFRSLPQIDDLGLEGDGPKLDACDPPQRLQIGSKKPNCFERAISYNAIAELIDPTAVRQLATIDLPIGRHTIALENGAPVILDPAVPRNAIVSGLAMASPGPVEVCVQDAIEWTADLAEASAYPYRNGPNRVRRARNALTRIVSEGVAPTEQETDLLGWMLALAERTAEQMGKRALQIVRTTALAIADVVDQIAKRDTEDGDTEDAPEPTPRNVAIEFGRTRLTPAPWLAGLARIAGRVGADVGAVALRAKLAQMGIGGDMFDLVEEELNREGLTMGTLAKPPRLATIADFVGKR